MARPKVDIDWERVNELLEADCEGTEIAAHLGIKPDTLYKRQFMMLGFIIRIYENCHNMGKNCLGYFPKCSHIDYI